MRTNYLRIVLLMSLPLLAGADYKPEHTPLWERMCAACHDGKTILNGSVVIDREKMKEKYGTVDDLVKAVSCEGPACMNILKHDEKLVRKVGKEIGIRDRQ
jgi:L-rhamnose mutarotase